MEVIEFILFMVASEMLHRIIKINIETILLDRINMVVQPIHEFCLDNLCDKLLMLNICVGTELWEEAKKILMLSIFFKN